MTSIGDAKYQATSVTPFEAQGDEYFAWLGANGGIGATVQDREYSFLSTHGVPAGSISGMWTRFLSQKGYTGALSDMKMAFWLDGAPVGGGSTAHLAINSMGLGDRTGTLVNSSVDAKTVIDYVGILHDTLAGELVVEGARRVDHADGQDYGYNALGIEYQHFPSTIPPRLRSLSQMDNLVRQSAIVDNPNSSANVTYTDGTAEMGRFTRSVSPNVIGTNAWYYMSGTGLIGAAQGTVQIFVKMDDGSVPRVGPGVTDPNVDFRIVVGNVGAPINKVQPVGGGVYSCIGHGTSHATNTNCGWRKDPGMSPKKFKVYALQAFNGLQAYPVYIHADVVLASWDADDINIPSAGNWFNDYGIALARFEELTGFNPAGESGGIMGTNNAAAGQLYRHSDLDTYAASDGTIAAKLTETILDNADVLLALCYVTGEGFTLQMSINGAAFSIVQAAYDGAFPDLGTLALFKDEGQSMKHVSLKIYHEGLAGKTLAELNQAVLDSAGSETAPV